MSAKAARLLKSLFRRASIPSSLLAVAVVLGLSGVALLGVGGVLSAPPSQVRQVQAIPEYSQRWRFGVGVDRSSGSIDNFNVSQLCMGWYSDWGTLLNPPRPEGVEFVQLIRVGCKYFDPAQPNSYNWADLDAKIRANPGSLWMIGNEPDGSETVPACDALTPADYATIYKIFYDHIKGIDSTAKLANGGDHSGVACANAVAEQSVGCLPSPEQRRNNAGGCLEYAQPGRLGA